MTGPSLLRHVSFRRLVPVVAALVLGSSAMAAPAGAATSYRLDLYRPGDFVSQTNTIQCIGASMQMMLNMLAHADDRTAARQLELQQLARSRSPRRFGDPAVGQVVRQRRGASAGGWASGLTKLGAGPYRVTSGATLEAAVQMAAQAIRETGKPAGLLVWRGAHAWVMSGFEATGDPLLGPSTITHVHVLDPWYPRVSGSWGPSPKPGTRLSLAELGQDFVRWRPNSTSAKANRYVVVLPFEPRLMGGRNPLP